MFWNRKKKAQKAELATAASNEESAALLPANMAAVARVKMDGNTMREATTGAISAVAQAEAQLKATGKDYSPWDLLKLTVQIIGGKQVPQDFSNQTKQLSDGNKATSKESGS